MTFFYHILSLLVAVIILPLFTLLSIFSKHKFKFLRHHFGFTPRRKKEGGKTVWLYALSLGEVKAAAPVLKNIHKKNSNLKIVVSVTTDSGYEGALENLKMAENIFFHPLDCLPFTWLVISRIQPDLFVVIAYRILPKSLLNIPKLGSINLHGSLLPKYRGAAPIQWSLINGDKQTGLSTFFIDSKIDTGAIIKQKNIQIKEYENYGILKERMAIQGSILLLDTINSIYNGGATPVMQNDESVTYAPKITKKMTIIDWNSSSDSIHNLIRGLSPLPGAQSRINGKKIKILETRIIENIFKSHFKPGQVVYVSKNQLLIKTGHGTISVIRLQLEGKKSLDIKSFLNGYTINIGDYFGD